MPLSVLPAGALEEGEAPSVPFLSLFPAPRSMPHPKQAFRRLAGGIAWCPSYSPNPHQMHEVAVILQGRATAWGKLRHIGGPGSSLPQSAVRHTCIFSIEEVAQSAEAVNGD